MSVNYVPYDNPVFGGKKLKLDTITPAVCEHGVVYRPRKTLFNYAAWPSVCRDENGTLYAVSAAFAMEHICPFTKFAMYISKNNGKTWSPPIVVEDSYISDGSGGILYLGNGRMLLHWAYHPGDVLYNEYYYRIQGCLYGGEPDAEGKLRGAMMDIYPELPPEDLIGGAFVKVSEDYGMTWSDRIRIPLLAPHGPTLCKDGTLIFLGKEHYACPDKTLQPDAFDGKRRIRATSYADYINQLNHSRCGTECGVTPVYAYASTDGGYTWEKRGLCDKPDYVEWTDIHEPHVTELPDGTLLGAVRVESEATYENDFTVFTTKSTDGGRTWSPMKPTHISGSPPHMLVHSSGKIICSVGRRKKPDLGEYAFISEDNGETWTKEYCINDLSPNDDLGYPCSVELEDGSILTVYYQKYRDPVTGEYDQKPCILCTHWTL